MALEGNVSRRMYALVIISHSCGTSHYFHIYIYISLIGKSSIDMQLSIANCKIISTFGMV